MFLVYWRHIRSIRDNFAEHPTFVAKKQSQFLSSLHPVPIGLPTTVLVSDAKLRAAKRPCKIRQPRRQRRHEKNWINPRRCVLIRIYILYIYIYTSTRYVCRRPTCPVPSSSYDPLHSSPTRSFTVAFYTQMCYARWHADLYIHAYK